ncbi:hypothetical protein SAMN05421732_101468 [Acinetobacter kookii]|uniref:Uncharacterized protein n=1 Tax=Acinetobacter kookii TaxID=1226327 RepID=A0A1G6GXW1_9GAMM|nr:hypothetical protein SAMN05421732_101468 [Acinetobacter kookii]
MGLLGLHEATEIEYTLDAEKNQGMSLLLGRSEAMTDQKKCD